jgi:hypothetical protein
MHARKCPLKAHRNCLVQTQFTQSYQAQLQCMCLPPFVPPLPSIHIQQIKAVIISAAHARCCTLIAHQAPHPPTQLAAVLQILLLLPHQQRFLQHLLYCCCCCMLHCLAHRRVTSTLCLRLSRLDCTTMHVHAAVHNCCLCNCCLCCCC